MGLLRKAECPPSPRGKGRVCVNLPPSPPSQPSPEEEEEKLQRTVFVGNVPVTKTTKDKLKDLFSK